jgi:very-short-patch-repair endonuclease
MTSPTFRERNTSRARSLRNEATPAERRLWVYLGENQLAGYKFTRQYQIGPYFVDFVCRKENFVVELDGISHDIKQEHDRIRTAFLNGKGYGVLRFNNVDVFENIEGVLEMIQLALTDRPTPSPSRKREGSI